MTLLGSKKLDSKKERPQTLKKETVYDALYYVGAPLFIGLFVGWGQSPVPELASHFTTAFYFAGFILIGWLCSICAMAIGKKVLEPWTPPLWILSIFPPMALGWLALIPMNFYLELTNGLLPPDMAILLKPLPLDGTPAFFQDYILSMVSVVFIFCGTNYLFQYLGFKDFRYGGTTSDATHPIAVDGIDRMPATSLPFVALLPKTLRGEPLCIQAQEHYIHVRTTQGAALIKYPFGNAVKSLDGFPGIQVHRSYWVHDDAVVGVTKIGQRFFITMDNGDEIPISQTYSKSVREHFATHFQSVTVKE